jgi:RHH-type proline utilization regulon transcriptional repressor/proline dehydrogenase/delta 1-pyrroline-5-carboxylate dehydrogenase
MCSFDMLGEGARTAADAARYEASYAAAIETVGRASNGAGPERGHGVSVKLSALSPRYEAVQEQRVWAELYPRLKRLALIAARHDLNFTIDAEEADRLVLSLKLLDRLAREPELGAVDRPRPRRAGVPEAQSPGHRAARRAGPQLRPPPDGPSGEGRLLGQRDQARPDRRPPRLPRLHHQGRHRPQLPRLRKALIEAAPHLYGQFATHNAHTLAAVRRMADRAATPIEFQRLHGMGEALYRGAGEAYGGVTLRAYAPVGGHEDLLPYLVRRLLENGANTSFVHALLDERVPASTVVVDPITAVEQAGPGPHPKIHHPLRLYGDQRSNSLGVDLSVKAERERLHAAVNALDTHDSPPAWREGPGVGAGREPREERRSRDAAALRASGTAPPPVAALARRAHPRPPPSSGRGALVKLEAAPADIDAAYAAARAAQPAWDALGGTARGRVLRAMADTLEANRDRLVALLAREAGKTLPDGVAEVREAADFCRYYAFLAEKQFAAPRPSTAPWGDEPADPPRPRRVRLHQPVELPASPSSPARSPPRSPPATPSSPSPPSRPR